MTAIAAIVVSFCCFGCSPVDKLDEKVLVRSPLDMVMWRANIARRQTTQERRELDDMIQELKFSVMLKGTATGSEAIEEAVREEINGRTLREILLKGHQYKRGRLLTEKSRLEVFIKDNASLRTRPGDTASADYLRRIREQQTAKLEEIDRELGIADGEKDGPGVVAQPKPIVEEAGDLDERPQLLSTGGR
jgi:hypothetical protein